MKKTLIYDRLIEIKAQKGKNSLFPNDFFKHPFAKSSKAQVWGLSDGSLLVKSAIGKKLWKKFDYD